MLTAFETLNIGEDASDESIKKAYLKQVRAYPPEQAPDKFQQIRDAYELIKTEKKRVNYQLFHHEKPSFTELLSQTLNSAHPHSIDETLFRAALAESLIIKS